MRTKDARRHRGMSRAPRRFAIGPGKPILCRAVRPYRQPMAATSSTSSPPRPHLVPDEAATTSSASSPPSRGDEGPDEVAERAFEAYLVQFDATEQARWEEVS